MRHFVVGRNEWPNDCVWSCICTVVQRYVPRDDRSLTVKGSSWSRSDGTFDTRNHRDVQYPVARQPVYHDPARPAFVERPVAK